MNKIGKGNKKKSHISAPPSLFFKEWPFEARAADFFDQVVGGGRALLGVGGVILRIDIPYLLFLNSSTLYYTVFGLHLSLVTAGSKEIQAFEKICYE